MIYLDCAATSLEKPQSVVRAVSYAMNHFTSAGRGDHSASMGAAEILYRCRETAASLFDVPDPERVILTPNATYGLNIAIKTLVKPGMRVLISGYEHNAVTRVLHAIPNVKISIAESPLFDGDECVNAFQRGLEQGTDVTICNHVSNAFGFIQPVERIAELCKQYRVPLIVDASQSAGTLPISLRKWNAAFIAMPGHKGLYGPQGTGILLCGSDPEPLIYGGTGSASIQQEMPDYLPDRLEAGTQNICGAAGLVAGMKYIQRIGVDRIRQHEQRLCQSMMNALIKEPNIRVFRGKESQLGLFSFIVDGMTCEEAGERLGAYGIAVRSGLHCAPLAHKTAGTLDSGTIRISFSAFSQMKQMEQAAGIIKRMVVERRAQ